MVSLVSAVFWLTDRAWKDVLETHECRLKLACVMFSLDSSYNWRPSSDLRPKITLSRYKLPLMLLATGDF